MPIIASQTIHVNVNTDKSIEVRMMEELSHNRCINLSSFLSAETETDQLHNIVKKLTGEKVIECNSGICCTSTNFDSFVDKLKQLRELD